MLNTEIKYNLSTNYCRLLELLIQGEVVVGFEAIMIDNKPNPDHSKVIEMKYVKQGDYFDIGGCLFGDKWHDEVHFSLFCKGSNIRFFDINAL